MFLATTVEEDEEFILGQLGPKTSTLLLSDPNCGECWMSEKCLVRFWGFIQSYCSWIRKWVCRQNNLTHAVKKKKRKKKTYGLISKLLLNDWKWFLGLFVNQRCSFWIVRRSPTADECLFCIFYLSLLASISLNVFCPSSSRSLVSDMIFLYCWRRANYLFCGCQCFTGKLQLYIL